MTTINMLLTLSDCGQTEHQISGLQTCWINSSSNKMSAFMQKSKANKAVGAMMLCFMQALYRSTEIGSLYNKTLQLWDI